MAFFGVAFKLYIHHKRQNIRSLFLFKRTLSIYIFYYLYIVLFVYKYFEQLQ
ncbi:hypothetical protein IGK30_003450 [Enterococcus sp. AZ178]